MTKMTTTMGDSDSEDPDDEAPASSLPNSTAVYYFLHEFLFSVLAKIRGTREEIA